MKVKFGKALTKGGEQVEVAYLQEKNDEFFIMSKQCFKRISTITSAKAIHLFHEFVSRCRYNDDRVELSSEQNKEIMKKLKLDRQQMWKLTKILVKAGLLIIDGETKKIPANIAFYGDRKTKQNLIKMYSIKNLQPNQEFESKGLKPNIKF